MATVRHLGMFPRVGLEQGAFEYCPEPYDTDDLIWANYLDRGSGYIPNLWIPPRYAAAVFWRVKKWKFSVSLFWAEVNAAEAVWQYDFEKEFEVGTYAPSLTLDGTLISDHVFGQAPESEKELVCGVGGVDFSFTDALEEEGTLIEGTSRSHFSLAHSGVSIASIGGTASPAAGTRASIELNYRHTAPPAFFRDNPDTSIREVANTIYFAISTFRWTRIHASPWQNIGFGIVPLGEYGTYSTKLLDRTFACPIYAYNSRSTLPTFTNTLQVSASLEAVEYWEYDPFDGAGPIYDKTTGKQIRAMPAL